MISNWLGLLVLCSVADLANTYKVANFVFSKITTT
jgi:hypothetical protein